MPAMMIVAARAASAKFPVALFCLLHSPAQPIDRHHVARLGDNRIKELDGPNHRPRPILIDSSTLLFPTATRRSGGEVHRRRIGESQRRVADSGRTETGYPPDKPLDGRNRPVAVIPDPLGTGGAPQKAAVGRTRQTRQQLPSVKQAAKASVRDRSGSRALRRRQRQIDPPHELRQCVEDMLAVGKTILPKSVGKTPMSRTPRHFSIAFRLRVRKGCETLKAFAASAKLLCAARAFTISICRAR